MTTKQTDTFNEFKLSDRAKCEVYCQKRAERPLDERQHGILDKHYDLVRQALEIVCQGNKQVEFNCFFDGKVQDLMFPVTGFEFFDGDLYLKTEFTKMKYHSRGSYETYHSHATLFKLKTQFPELA